MTTSLKGLTYYKVGGAVRDRRLNIPHRENDWVVVGSTEEEMLKRGFKKVGKDFPVFLHPETKEEYALARTERKKGRGYYGFECDASREVTLEQDLLRRDLTINAMAETEDGKLIDPYHGERDLKNKILRHVSPAFAEDPVRILRLARFAAQFHALGFSIAKETEDLIKEMVNQGEVDYLVPERVWQEMQKALNEASPSQFFLVLKDCGALERLWPALNKLWSVPERLDYHPEGNTGIHTMLALEMAAKLTKDPMIRFAVLCHDLGKGETPESEWPSHRMHEERGVPLILAFAKQYRIPKEYRALAVLLSRYHLLCHSALELKPKTLLNLFEKLDAFRRPERFQKFLKGCEADARGRKGLEERIYPQPKFLWDAFLAAKSVSSQAILGNYNENSHEKTADINGMYLAKKLREARIFAITAFKKAYENKEN